MVNKYIMIRRFFTLLVLLIAAPSTGLAVDAGEVLKKLQNTYNTVQTISAEFTQVTTNAFGENDPLTGKLEIKKPGKMRWTYSEPEGDLIITNGVKYWMLQADLNQAVEVNAKDGTPPVAFEFLIGEGNLDKDFTAKVLEDKKTFIKLGLTPKGDMNVRDLKIKVRKKDNLIEMIELSDIYGSITKVTLKDIKVNKKIDDSVFDFIVPKGVHLVKPQLPKNL